MNKTLWTVVGLVAVLVIAGALMMWLAPSEPAAVDTENETGTSQNVSQNQAPTNPATQSASGAAGAAGSRVLENGRYVTIVHLTSTGFSPKSVIIWSGEEVRFVNKTSLAMRIGAREENLSSPDYNGFIQPEGEGRNGTYQLAFTKPGLFSYYNVAGPSQEPAITGTVFVK